MNSEDFEQVLLRQPLRTAPEPWRREVLEAARARAGAEQERIHARAFWPNIVREWLWPHPAAWGGLAACWAAIVLLQHLTAPSTAEIVQARAEARVAAAYSRLLAHPAAMALTMEPIAEPHPARSERRSPDLGCRGLSLYSRAT